MDNGQKISSEDIEIFDNHFSKLYKRDGAWQDVAAQQTIDEADIQTLFPNLSVMPTAIFADDVMIHPGSSTYQGFLNSDLISNESVEVSSSPTLMGSVDTVTPTIMDIQSTSQRDEVPRSYKSPSSLPASQNWAGEYDFQMKLEKTVKNTTWMFSPSLTKLYINLNASCPISFSTRCSMSEGVKIRATALYSSPESVSEIVERCVNHIQIDSKQNILEAEHLVRCVSNTAEYEIDEVSGHKSVLVPFENPSAGQSFSTYIYKFACLSSCSSPGPNRRPLMVVFSLLDRKGQVIGRRKLDVKICAYVSRDMIADEQSCLRARGVYQEEIRERKSANHISGSKNKKRKVDIPGLDNLLGHSSVTKKIKTEPNSDGYYQIKVKDKKCYEFLEQMKNYFEIMKTFKGMPPEVKEKLKRYQQRKGYEINLDE